MIILDGGIGSEMDRRVSRKRNDDPTWCGSYHLTDPLVLRQVYEEYVASGAQMLSANTYSILQYLTKADEGAIQASVSKAVDIVRDVRKAHPHVRIAGCVSAHGSDDHSEAEIRKSISLLASCLANCAVDCILVEMVQSRRIGRIMVQAADTADVPLMIGFSVIRDENGSLRLKKSDAFFTADLVSCTLHGAKNVRGVGVMHSEVGVVDDALCEIEKVWTGDLIAYPDHGVFEKNCWTSNGTYAIETAIATQLCRCKDLHPRLSIVGGCCGLGPSFIKSLAQL